jgi:hypothetical protein
MSDLHFVCNVCVAGETLLFLGSSLDLRTYLIFVYYCLYFRRPCIDLFRILGVSKPKIRIEPLNKEIYEGHPDSQQVRD